MMSFWAWFTEAFFGWKWTFKPCNRHWKHDITKCPGHWERVHAKNTHYGPS